MAPHGQIVGYVRVSSADQNLARQLEAIEPVDRLFQDKVSGGSRANRAGLTECLRYVRADDTVRVASIDRLARSLIDLQQLVDEILTRGASVHFIKEGHTYSAAGEDSMSRLMLQILGAFATGRVHRPGDLVDVVRHVPEQPVDREQLNQELPLVSRRDLIRPLQRAHDQQPENCHPLPGGRNDKLSLLRLADPDDVAERPAPRHVPGPPP